jgi:hypothetical protein
MSNLIWSCCFCSFMLLKTRPKNPIRQRKDLSYLKRQVQLNFSKLPWSLSKRQSRVSPLMILLLFLSQTDPIPWACNRLVCFCYHCPHCFWSTTCSNSRTAMGGGGRNYCSSSVVLTESAISAISTRWYVLNLQHIACHCETYLQLNGAWLGW